MYKATGFTLESLGVKQQCLHCCGEVKLGGHVNMLIQGKHRHGEFIRDNFPAKLHVNDLPNPAREDGQLRGV